MMKNFGYGDGWVLAATSMLSLGAIISLRWWGKLADSFGNRAIFSLSHIGIIICTLMWILLEKGTFGTVLIFVLFFLTSVFNSGNSIAQTRYLFHAIPEQRQNHINLINTMANAAAAIGPLAGGFFLWLLKDVKLKSGALDMNNYHIFFVINALIFIIPHMMRRGLRAEKELPTTQVIAMVTRPIRYIMGPFIDLDLTHEHLRDNAQDSGET
jgi:MFS family permease